MNPEDNYGNSLAGKITFTSYCMTSYCQEFFPLEFPKFLLLLLRKLKVGFPPTHESSPGNKERN